MLAGAMEESKSHDLPYHCFQVVYLAIATLLPFVWFRHQLDPAGLPRVWVIQLSLLPAMVHYCYRQGWRALPPKVLRYLGYFTALAGLSFIWSRDYRSALYQFAWLLTFVQLYLLGAYLGRCQIFRRFWLWAAILGGALIAMLGCIQTYQAEVPPFVQIYPPSATFLNKNIAAQYLMAILPLSIFLMISEKSVKLGWLWSVLSGLILFYHVMASSRTAWVASLITMLAVSIYAMCCTAFRQALRELPRRIVLARILLCLMVMGLIIPGREHRGIGSRLDMEQELYSLARFGDLGEGQINTAKVRIAMYVNALIMILEHPVAGVGLDNFQTHYPRYHNRLMETPTYRITTLPAKLHNDLLQIVVELGLVGAAFFGLFLCYHFKAAHEAVERAQTAQEVLIRVGILTGFFGLVVLSLGTFPMRMPVSAFWFWMGGGILVSQTETTRTPELRDLKWGIATLIPNLVLLYVYLRAVLSGGLLYAGSVYYARQQPVLAFAYTYHAHQTFPAGWQAQDQLLTLATNDQQNRTRALQIAQDFLIRSPYHPNGHYRLALILKATGQAKAALNALAQAVKYGEPDAETAYLEGMLRLGLGQEQAAREAFQQALHYQPDHQPSQEALAALP